MADPLRRRDARYRWEMSFGPSMTPMVDVVLVILVFFMASAIFAKPERWFETQLAEQGSQETNGDGFALPEPVLEVRVERVDGATLCTGLGVRGASVEELSAAARASSTDLERSRATVVIVPDDDVSYEDAVRVHDALTGAGIRRVGVR